MAYACYVRSLLPGLFLSVALGQSPAPAPDREIPIENEWVRVVLVHKAEPHRKTRVHKHDMNRVMIYLNEGSQTIEYTEGKKEVEKIRWKAGEALWSPAGGLHTAEITSKEPARIVEIELRKLPGGTQMQKPPRWPAGAKVELENAQVTVVRMQVPPGGSAPGFDPAAPSVVTWVRAVPPNGKIVEWRGHGQVVLNPGKNALEAVIVYLKL